MFRLFDRGIRLTLRRPARAWLLVRMAAWVVILSGLVRVLTLPRALRFVATEVRTNSKDDIDVNSLSSAIDTMLGLDVWVFTPKCWKRATVLHRYLALNGIATSIVFGVRKEADELKGHAWLQADGRPFLESEPPLYNITYSFPSTQSFDAELAAMGQPALRAINKA
jgi:transglutaminase superfamily protein